MSDLEVVLYSVHRYLTGHPVEWYVDLDDLYAKTKYDNDLAWIIMSAQSTGQVNFLIKSQSAIL